ncbi:hypothetical protein BsWGS_16126 [Bradybaena similaris]
MTQYSSVRLGFHGCVFMVYSISFVYDSIAMDSLDYSYLGRLKFVTVWNMILQLVYSFACLVVDIHDRTEAASPPQKPRWRLQRARDTLHTAIIFPFGTFCVLVFWGLYFTDRELVYPQKLDNDLKFSYIFNEEQLRDWQDAIIMGRKVNSLVIKHTLTLVFTLCDKFLVHHRYPKLLVGVCISTCVPLAYIVLLAYLGFQHGFWVYPFMAHLDLTQRLAIVLACFVPIAILQVIGKCLTAIIWRGVYKVKET